MLSVVLYGRNDSHGYNLHKRAAISLNAISAVLSDPDDEIIFVDYNTPDDLPTFPEAIQDTLSPETHRRLRIIRVRQKHHQRLSGATHLVAIEPVSRNVAIRRANPANRWVLSTNTDMIFVPRDPGKSLSSIVSGLEDGFYHLPRFELPETLWESLDRREGARIVEAVRGFGNRFHLNEIVYGGDHILYDAPGDFQLFMRDDLFRIKGFDERMILGWHVDSNVAVRMKLLRSRIDSCVESLFGYHCDHTRMATGMHGHDRVENSLKRFVDEIADPVAPGQEDWGLANEQLEEIDLRRSHASSYIAALTAAMPNAQTQLLESHYRSDSFNSLGYDVSHVMPYLADLLAALPRDLTIGYSGARESMAAKFIELCRALGLRLPVLTDEALAAEWSACPADAKLVPQSEISLNADLLIFEFGIHDGSQSPAELAGLAELDTKTLSVNGAVLLALRKAVRDERERLRSNALCEPRRFIVINAVNNAFESFVNQNIAITYTPYGCRVRHGFVITDRPRPPERGIQPRNLAKLLQGYMGRPLPVPQSEIRVITEDVAAYLQRPNDPVARKAFVHAAPALARLLHEESVQAEFGLSRERVEALMAELEAQRGRAKANLAPRFHRSSIEPGDRPLSRLASMWDWESRDWREIAEANFGGRDAGSAYHRAPGVWEAVHPVYGLLKLSQPSALRRVAVISRAPFSIATVVGIETEADVFIQARDDFVGARHERLFVPASRLRWQQDLRSSAPYDAVIWNTNAVSKKVRNKPYSLFREAASLLRPDGILAYVDSVDIPNGRQGSLWRVSLIAAWFTGKWQPANLASPMVSQRLRSTGMKLIDQPDMTVDDWTLDCSGDQWLAQNRHAIGQLDDTRLRLPAAIFMRKVSDAGSN